MFIDVIGDKIINKKKVFHLIDHGWLSLYFLYVKSITNFSYFVLLVMPSLDFLLKSYFYDSFI